MLKFFVFFIPSWFLCFFSDGQSLTILDSGKAVSLRGLSVVSDSIIWASGSAGTVVLSFNGGRSWQWMKVNGFENADFRDIEAFSKDVAIVMATTHPAAILKTTDGGSHWKTVFSSASDSLFLDAIDFSGSHGMVVGDPTDGKFFLAETKDSGNHWTLLNSSLKNTQPVSGEAFFAASGSNILLKPGGGFVLVSGGKRSSFYNDSERFDLQMLQGIESTGANSISLNPSNSNQAFIIGGDFTRDSLRKLNGLLITLTPFTQITPDVPPFGYRSCVTWLDDKNLIACGTSGVDRSCDGGLTWTRISMESFHVCRSSKKGNVLFLAGSKGRIARLLWQGDQLLK